MARNPTSGHHDGGSEAIKESLGIFQIGRTETFSEPTVDGGEKIASFDAAALVAAEPGEAHSSAQFPEFGLLLPGNAQSVVIELFRSLRMP